MMKINCDRRNLIVLFTVLVFLLTVQNIFAQTAPYTPEKGTVERKAILDGVRKYRKAPNEIYTPTEFKVQSGWAYISAEDPNEPGVDTAAFSVILHKTGKSWKVVDEVRNVEGSDFSKEIKRIRKKFPSAPIGIFP